jgi:hypothetical protein
MDINTVVKSACLIQLRSLLVFYVRSTDISLQRVLFSGILRRVFLWKSINVSEGAEPCFLPVSHWFPVWFFFEPEDGGEMFLRNVGWISTDYTALYPRRQEHLINPTNPNKVWKAIAIKHLLDSDRMNTIARRKCSPVPTLLQNLWTMLDKSMLQVHWVEFFHCSSASVLLAESNSSTSSQ